MQRQLLIYLIICFKSLHSFSQTSKTREIVYKIDRVALAYAKSIQAEELKKYAHTIASDSMEGRKTGSNGQRRAANYLSQQMKRIGLLPAYKDSIQTSYFQKYTLFRSEQNYNLYKRSDAPKEQKGRLDTENVIGYVEGTDKKEEYVVISGHYDHIGVLSNQIFYGADDNASGTSTILEIAEAFSLAAAQGHRPRRTVVFILFSGEEIGLYGSQYYSDFEPVFPLENTVVDLNIDMVGRVDDKYTNFKNSDYTYVIGADRVSKKLDILQKKVNEASLRLTLDYTFDAKDHPERLFSRSDHYNFAKKGIPVIFYYDGMSQDYHKPTDTPDKLNYEKMAKIGQLVFLTAWEIANQEERLKD